MISRLTGFYRKTTARPMFTAADRKNVAWFFNTYLKKRTPWLMLVMGLILVQGLAYQQFLSLTENGLRVIFDDGQVTDLVLVCAMVFGLFTVRGITSYIVPRVSTWLASNAVLEMRRHLVERLLGLHLSYFDRTTSGDVILKIVQQAQGLSQFVGQATVNAVRDAVTVVIVSSYLIYKAPTLFLTAVVIAPVILYTLQAVSSRIKDIQAQAESLLGAYMNSLEETTNGMRTVKIANQERFEQERLDKANVSIRDLSVRLQAAQAIVLPAIDIASAFAYALVIGLGGYFALQPEYDMDGATIITFLIGLVMVFDPLRSLAKFFTNLQAKLIILRGVRELMLTQPAIIEKPDARDDFDRTGDIVFDDVHFSYSDDAPLFEDLNLTFEGGTRSAIVGATGSGKTTILSLLGRLYEPTQGRITIGGTDIADLKIDKLRRSFSVVAQDIVIFNASIWDNIAYVNPDATDEEIWHAAENAEIADLVRARGDTPLGPKGAQLSGGQKQRISIARAFLRPAPILLLDEATSALDQRTEEKVKRALMRLSEGKTTLIVAHRLSAIADADKIFVLDAGRVVEAGTHEELLDLKGLYSGMYGTQKSEYR